MCDSPEPTWTDHSQGNIHSGATLSMIIHAQTVMAECLTLVKTRDARNSNQAITSNTVNYDQVKFPCHVRV